MNKVPPPIPLSLDYLTDSQIREIEKRKKEFRDECEKKAIELKKNPPKEDDPHIACYSYPCCDEAPNGCKHVMGDDVEPYGHRD